MGKSFIGVIASAVAAIALLLLPPAAMAQVPAGNLFYQNGAPSDPNTSIAINNPQNMAGGNWVGGSTAQYPVYGPSPVLDGVVSSGSLWNAGTFSGGGMCNIAVTQGYYSSDASSFTNVAFGQIATIRIWAAEQPTPSGIWDNFAQQVAVAYTTSAFNPGNGFSYNSATLGVLPGTWNNMATISLVNGAAPTAPTDSTDYSTANGWVAGDFSQGVTAFSTGDYAVTAAYMDLTVDIPTGATSIMVSFGQDNTATGNQGGLMIVDLQAFAPVPEPASTALLALGGIGMLAQASIRVRKMNFRKVFAFLVRFI